MANDDDFQLSPQVHSGFGKAFAIIVLILSPIMGFTFGVIGGWISVGMGVIALYLGYRIFKKTYRSRGKGVIAIGGITLIIGLCMISLFSGISTVAKGAAEALENAELNSVSSSLKHGVVGVYKHYKNYLEENGTADDIINRIKEDLGELEEKIRE